MGRLAVEAKGLGKRYKLFDRPSHRLLESLAGGRRRWHREHWALRDIDLALERGHTLGVIGSNGSGKTTLLRILAGVTHPTTGEARVEGRVSSLLELGAGFHSAFSGRENVRLAGTLLGFRRSEVEERIAWIEDFSELGDFFDRPVRTYSAGMGMRLAFSVALAVRPDVLLIDEVFAVGDMHFQKKCVDKIFDLKRSGCTILFCSHSLYDVRQICDDAIWVRGGKIAGRGDAITVTNDYAAFERSLEPLDVEKTFEAIPRAPGERELPRILEARLHAAGEEREIREILPGDAVEVRVWYHNPTPDRTPIHLGVGYLRNDSTLCVADSTEFEKVRLPGREGCVVHRVPRVRLLSGTFHVFAILFDERGVHRYDQFILREPLVVRSRGKEVGLFLQDHEWSVRPGERPPGARAEGDADRAGEPEEAQWTSRPSS